MIRRFIDTTHWFLYHSWEFVGGFTWRHWFVLPKTWAHFMWLSRDDWFWNKRTPHIWFNRSLRG